MAEACLNQRRQCVLDADGEHGPTWRAIDNRTLGHDDTWFTALAQSCMQQRLDGRCEAYAIASHCDRLIRRTYLEVDPAVVALMHIARHLTKKRREIDLLP